MPSPSPITPRQVGLSELKSKIFNLSLTSYFQCFFNPPEQVRHWSKDKESASVGAQYDSNAELFSFLCHEAVLPGSSLATIDIDNDYHGVSQKNAYRRAYDDRADFTFYVDVNYDSTGTNYSVLQFFENWMSFIVNERINVGVAGKLPGIEDSHFTYRMNYPGPYTITGKSSNSNTSTTSIVGGYKSPALYVNKFEKDFNIGKFLQYRLINAFPISINSMPLSYDQSQILKCTVSFNYERYIISTEDLPNPDATTTTETPGLTQITTLPTAPSSIAYKDDGGNIYLPASDGSGSLVQIPGISK